MLIFSLKKEWYKKIKSGEKSIEYRILKPYWASRFAKEFDFNQNSFCNIGDKMEMITYYHPQDNKMLDKYMDDILGDLKLTSKQAYGLLGLCKICYSMGMIEMQKIKDFEKEHQEEIKENDR